MGRLGFVLLVLALSTHAVASPQAAIDFSISPRTPEQTTAFYSARGFPAVAVQAIAEVCLLTVGIYNRGDEVVWLEPARWEIRTDKGQPVRRITRPEWDAHWETLAVPLAARATFGWTQLPESRDLQPGEPVGGNIAVIPPTGPFNVTAHFRTGRNGAGKPLSITVRNLTCPR